MMISLILLLIAYLYQGKVKDSSKKSTKDRASRLVIAAWVFFAISLGFLILVVSTGRHSSNMLLALAFPIVTFFTHRPNRGSKMIGEYVGDRKNYFQPNRNVGGEAPSR